MGFCRNLAALNPNVRLTLFLSAVGGLADSLWSGTVLAAYLYEIDGDRNARVGYVEAASGLATLVTALPVGWAADKLGRGLVAACGGALSFAAVGLTVSAVLAPLSERAAFWWLLCAMSLWGIVAGASGPIEALYADSVPTGERSASYFRLFCVDLLAESLGPLITIGVFVARGDRWSLATLRAIIAAAMALELVAALFMFGFRDAYALGHEAEHVGADDDDDDGDEAAAADDDDDDDDDASENATAPPADAAVAARRRARRRVPCVLFVSNLATALGSGMSVKFFPLYFKQDCGLSPVAVQCLYAGVPLLMLAFGALADRLARAVGRVQVMMLFQLVGVTLLLAMVALERALGRAPPLAMVPLYLARTGVINATYPLAESVLMDFAPRSTRARWKSLESVAQFGWCGSAALGGVLADAHDYRFTFTITAAWQGLGALAMLPLLAVVPRREAPVRGKARGDDAPAALVVNDLSETLSEPLLTESGA